MSRDDGSLRATIANLPGIQGPDFGDRPVPPGLLEGLVDDEMVEVIWAFIFGRFIESANTPAVQPSTGRIFATGTGTTEEWGALYGIDYTPSAGSELGTIEFATTSNTGPGSGSSPAISPDGTQVYVSDDDGTLFAFNAMTGAEVWSVAADAFAGMINLPEGLEILAPNLGGLEALTPAPTGGGGGRCSAGPVGGGQAAGLSLLLLVCAALLLRRR